VSNPWRWLVVRSTERAHEDPEAAGQVIAVCAVCMGGAVLVLYLYLFLHWLGS
jgi:hypothetical protein